MLARLVLVAVTLVLSGCAHYGPPGWPQEIGGRPVRDAGSVWVYARSADSAQEAAALIRSVAPGLPVTEPSSPRGVVIVTEQGEVPPEITSVQGGAAGMVRDLAASIPEPRLRARIEQNADALAGLVAVGASGRTLQGATALPPSLRSGAPFVVSIPSESAVLSVFRSAREAVVEEARLPLLQRQLLARTLEMGRDEFIMRVRETHADVLRGVVARPSP
jgi:hypothetical protein